MNTTPDEERLALWVEDELDATSQAAVDAWAATQPEWQERREVARQMKSFLRGSLPAAEEPPYAEFFNARIAREIQREAAVLEPVAPAARVAPLAEAPGRIWRWFLPATAVAGMVLCFWAGTRISSSPSHVAGPTLPTPASTPVLYTPEQGVQADYFASAPAGGMVIVLDGVAAIPDSFEVPDTASTGATPGESTADLDPPTR
ncbi:anti-sigma factor family protein [Luteolibacter soli]|uniref:Anti sigma-E protein RseA N-terminal domain-containing protein n=1 Tax=Luteolibacter soli TaxID=3135280 RepID=A0ABU9AZE6_9BACT